MEGEGPRAYNCNMKIKNKYDDESNYNKHYIKLLYNTKPQQMV